MPRIELAQLLRPTTTPEQELLLEHFYTQFDNRSAANRQIVNVESLFYEGAIAGTEFLVYAATKLYICYYINFCGLGITNNDATVFIYDEANNLFLRYSNDVIFYNTTLPLTQYWGNNINLKNIYFSRITNQNYNYLVFTGYRITLI